MNLGSRFTLLFGILSLLVAVFLITVFDRTLRRAVEDRVSERLTGEVAHLADDLTTVRRTTTEDEELLRRAAVRLSSRLTLIEPDGKVAHETGLLPAEVASMDNHAHRPEVRDALTRGSGSSRRYSKTQRMEMLYVARRLPDGRVLRAAVSATRLSQLESSYLWPIRAAIAAACFLLFLIGTLASARFSRPIGDLTRAASAIARGDFDRDLPKTGGEELRILGGSLQSMKDALASAFARAESERRLTATVFERLPDGLVIVDAKLHVVEANERFGRMIGIPLPTGRALWDLLRNRALLECFEGTLRTGEICSRTVHLEE